MFVSLQSKTVVYTVSGNRDAGSKFLVSETLPPWRRLSPRLVMSIAPLVAPFASWSLCSKRQALNFVVTNAATKGSAGDVHVPAAAGQLTSRIIKKLLEANFRVIAGSPDTQEASEAISIFKKLELLRSAELANLKLVEVDPNDTETVLKHLPKQGGGRVVVVVGDSLAGRRPDVRAAENIVAALLDTEEAPVPQQLVLVTPTKGLGGFGGFGRGAPRLTKIEQAVVDSGLNYLIVRTANYEGVADQYADVSRAVVGGFGSLDASAKVARSQVAAAVVAAMQQPIQDAVLEISADPQQEPADVEALVAEAWPEMVVEVEEEEEVEVEEEEEAVENQAKPGLFGGFNFQLPMSKKDAPPAEEEEEEEAEELEVQAGKKDGWFSFGRPRVTAVEEVEDLEEAKPAGGRLRR